MPFHFEKCKIDGLIIIEPVAFPDNRGWFLESYKRSDFINNGISELFVQDNNSYSNKNVLRGVHFQTGKFAQGKLVRCTSGTVWDVAVDLRKNSATYGEYFAIELSANKRNMFYIPPGFAHGFLTLSDTSEFQYKCTEEYYASADSGIRFDDPIINIKWPVDTTQIIVSDKDRNLPTLNQLGKEFSL
jgi:dTDP-4-dehydrorhamnose 3,5-epimerase